MKMRHNYQAVEFKVDKDGECVGDEHILSWGYSVEDAIADADRCWNHLTLEEQKKSVVEVRHYTPDATESDDYDIIYRNGAWIE